MSYFSFTTHAFRTKWKKTFSVDSIPQNTETSISIFMNFECVWYRDTEQKYTEDHFNRNSYLSMIFGAGYLTYRVYTILLKKIFQVWLTSNSFISIFDDDYFIAFIHSFNCPDDVNCLTLLSEKKMTAWSDFLSVMSLKLKKICIEAFLWYFESDKN